VTLESPNEDAKTLVVPLSVSAPAEVTLTEDAPPPSCGNAEIVLSATLIGAPTFMLCMITDACPDATACTWLALFNVIPVPALMETVALLPEVATTVLPDTVMPPAGVPSDTCAKPSNDESAWMTEAPSTSKFPPVGLSVTIAPLEPPACTVLLLTVIPVCDPIVICDVPSPTNAVT
jgi:hypothetical protein